LKTSRKVTALLAAAVLLVAFVVAASFWVFSQLGAAGEARKHTFDAIIRANALLSALKDAETGQRGYALTGDEAFLEPYLAVRDGLKGQLEELQQRTLIVAAGQHLAAIAPLIAAKLAELSAVIELRRNNDMAGVLAAVGDRKGKRLMDSIRAEANSFIKIEEGALAERDAEFQANMHRLFFMTGIAGALLLLLVLSCVYLINGEKRHRLKELVHRETQHSLEIQTEANKALERASRMKTEFLATMSHELRTPLNAIIGFSEALKEGLVGPISEAQRQFADDIFTSGHHLLSLINDILDLSKVEAGMMALELEPVDLKSLLSSSLTIVREKAASQRVSLEVDAGEDLGVPVLDMRKTKQIVYNLLSNAVKFSANGGRVVLRARRVPRGSVGTLSGAWPVRSFPLADSEYGEFLEISVSDSGIGISQENLARLFQAFSQIDSSLARKFEGTGLGLAMVKQLSELHGGTVAVASAEGAGACFAAWLPIRTSVQAETPLNRATGAAAAGTEPKERVALVVEDDDMAAKLVRVLLEAEGFKVVWAASAEEALVLARRQTLSLITLDIGLPGIDGWEFLNRIRKSDTLAHVPVVIVSGLEASDMVLTDGAAAVLQKPVSRAQLKTSLANLGLHPVHERTHTVLVVDDDPKAVELIAAFLPAPAYAVVRAYGGSEAITLAQRLRPDLILLDLMMPHVSGFDVVEALQRNANTARIPILVVTAKQITTQDRAVLNGDPANVIHIVEKAGFNNVRFIAEVRRALLPH
jgi:signal transduction histidine kinase/DNA-binding response OmpR family regulator